MRYFDLTHIQDVVEYLKTAPAGWEYFRAAVVSNKYGRHIPFGVRQSVNYTTKRYLVMTEHLAGTQNNLHETKEPGVTLYNA